MVLNSMLQNSPVALFLISALVLLAYGAACLVSTCARWLRRHASR